MARTRKRKTAAETGIVELSMKIDEQLERLDELCFEYNVATDSVRRYNVRECIRAACQTIRKNRKLLRKLDGGFVR